MGSYGRIRISEIRRMLDECAKGHEWVDSKQHNFQVKWQGRTYPSLPKGEHGKSSARIEIESGHVKKLARFFGIIECAKEILEQLR